MPSPTRDFRKAAGKDLLPNGSHVAFYKDALYADHRIARHLTGATALELNPRPRPLPYHRGGLPTLCPCDWQALRPHSWA
jgi:hypothetical protein